MKQQHQIYPSPSPSSPQDLSQIYTLLLHQSPRILQRHQMSLNDNRRTRNDDNNSNNNHEEEDEPEEPEEEENEVTATKTKKKKSLQGIITSLLLLEDHDNQNSDELTTASIQDKSRRDKTLADKTKSLTDFYAISHDQSQPQEFLSAKRKRSTASAAVAAAAATAKTSGEAPATVQQRRLWVKDRSKAWWDECNSPEFPEEEFKRAFRMGKSTFELICEELNSVIAKEDTTLRNAIPVRQRVAVCLWRLATGDPLRLVSKRFGLGISTCHKLVLEVCSAIRTVLMPKYLQWPNDESAAAKIKDSFESSSGIPNVIGSMYTTHIPIIAPKISVAAYFNKRHTERNQKTSYSITVQGVVDQRGVFTDVCIGWPGSMPDEAVLEKSALHQRASTGLLRGSWVAGGPGYPLTDWVLVPYTQHNLTWTQHAFNEKMGEVRRVARDAFARLKGRWSCLQRRTEVKLQDLPVVLGACCVLHNICEIREDGLDPEFGFELFDDEMLAEAPVRSEVSRKARDTIAHNLLHHGLAGTGFL